MSFFGPMYRPIFPKVVADEAVPEGTVLLIGPQLCITQVFDTDGKVIREWYEGIDGCAVIKNVGTEDEK